MKHLEQLLDVLKLVLKNPKPVFKYSPSQQNNIPTMLSRASSHHYIADLEQVYIFNCSHMTEVVTYLMSHTCFMS